MKKRLLLLALLLMQLVFDIAAKKHDVIYTNDGKVYKGEVVEFLPGKAVTVEQCEGGRVTLDYSSVAKYAKEPEDIFLKKGYRGFCFLEACAGKNAYIGFSMSSVHGIQLCPNFFAGAGFQYRMGTEGDRHLPLFLNAHYDVSKFAKTPYFDARFGTDILLTSDGYEVYSTNQTYDYYASLSLGYRIKHFVVDFGVETIHYVVGFEEEICNTEFPEYPSFSTVYYNKEKSLNFFLKFGLSF